GSIDFAVIDDFVQRAYSVYSKDPMIAINVGLVRLRGEQYEEALQLLGGWISAAGGAVFRLVSANVAYTYIYQKNYSSAIGLLNSVVAYLQDLDTQNPLDSSDLPGIGLWIDFEDDDLNYSLESFESVVPLLSELLQAVSHEPNTDTSSIQWLLDAFNHL